MTLPVEKNKEKYTYKDLCSWPENERWELIGGEAFDMPPHPLPHSIRKYLEN
ncbi:MAG: hypothetical protein HQM08_24625 [Candidatus Riflebacteria bacterium]|nr:hypothetical protein [Candidatus Riflebacteria bacterium]